MLPIRWGYWGQMGEIDTLANHLVIKGGNAYAVYFV